MPMPSLTQGSRQTLRVLENNTSTSHSLGQGLERRLVPSVGMITKPLVAEFANLRDRPALAAVVMMPLVAFMFVGLFFGELIGALLGIYFAGINIIFLRNRTPSARTAPAISSPCIDLIPEKS